MKQIKITISFLSLLLILALMIFSHSCANPGAGPEGGPRDTIPPVILSSIPETGALNYKEQEITLTFDEYVVAENLSSKIVISPPLAEKVEIRTKGKSVVVKINEELIPNRTYSVDFKDGIKDFNEGNPYPKLRMLFSTGDEIDTLRIGGFLLDAFNKEPVENALVTLYSVAVDSLFRTLKPDFIATTNKEGYFLFDNLPEGEFQLYGLLDQDKDLLFSNETEAIAFVDSMLIPDARYIPQIDTLFENNDTLVSYGYTDYKPDSVIAYVFTHDIYNQFIASSERKSRDRISFIFNESLSDSFRYRFVKPDVNPDQLYDEFGIKRDSLDIWITDTLLSKLDTLQLKLDYSVLDSMEQPTMRTDTLIFTYKEPVAKKPKKKNDEKAKATPKNIFELETNLTTNNFDLFKNIVVSASLPLNAPEDSVFRLLKVLNDSVSEAIDFQYDFTSGSKREMELSYQPEPETKYKLEVDSATIRAENGFINLPLSKAFKTQKKDYYGTVIFEIKNWNRLGIFQVLKSSGTEGIVRQVYLDSTQTILTLNYMKPGDYKLKLIDDQNNNKVWDTGDYSERRQAEKVWYFPKVIKVKSNWELKETWEVPKKAALKMIESEKSTEGEDE